MNKNYEKLDKKIVAVLVILIIYAIVSLSYLVYINEKLTPVAQPPSCPVCQTCQNTERIIYLEKVNYTNSVTILEKLDSEHRTQEQWISYFNERNQKMISAPDIYNAVKEGQDIDSLKQDFKDWWVITSTQIDYDAGTITHDKGSTIVKEKVIKVKIPVYSGYFEQNTETEAYLQALFDTKDKLPEIIKVMQKMADGRTIRLWTPSQESRANKPVRSVDFNYNYFGDRFYVDGYYWDIEGLSRGVSVGKKTAGETQ